MGCGVAEFVFGAALGWFHKGRRQFAISGWLLITSAAGLLVLAFPYTESNPHAVGKLRLVQIHAIFAAAVGSEIQAGTRYSYSYT